MARRKTSRRSPARAPRPSLRSWVEQLDTAGELRRVKAEVDWDEEIGALTRISLGLGGPALLFENIKDHGATRCTKLLTASMGTKAHVALMLGLPRDTSDAAIVRHLKNTFRAPVKAVMVRTGPVKEHVLRGRQIDLGQFPVPKWHHLDGGRFIDTFGGVVTRDP